MVTPLDIYASPICNPALERDGWSKLALYPRERPHTHSRGGWVGLEASVVSTENLTATGILSPNHPACGKLVH